MGEIGTTLNRKDESFEGLAHRKLYLGRCQRRNDVIAASYLDRLIPAIG
jgi:hypothetical protein